MQYPWAVVPFRTATHPWTLITLWTVIHLDCNLPGRSLMGYIGGLALLHELFALLIMNPDGLQIATVDKYQGQQNDYILLSLVRTRAVGHIRDVRRLVVALSRARLGLYIFGRAELFANCYELRPAMKQLLARPQQLHLHPSERVAVSMLSSSPPLGSWELVVGSCELLPSGADS